MPVSCHFPRSLGAVAGRLGSVLALLAGVSTAVAQPAAARAEPTILVADIQSARPEAPSQPSSRQRAELRAALAAHLRRQLGTAITPPLSDEEQQCSEVSCAVRFAQRYFASALLWASLDQSPGSADRCALYVIAVPIRAEDGATAQPIQRQLNPISCKPAVLQEQLNRVGEELLLQLGLARRVRPLCRYRYDNFKRGLATGIGAGLTLAGGGLGFGLVAERERSYAVGGAPELQVAFAGLEPGIGVGFAGLSAGLLIGGSALLPWERLLTGPNPPECIQPPSGRFGLRRSALVGFFATSLLSSLASTIYFAVPQKLTVSGLPTGTELQQAALSPGYAAASGVLLGTYAVGLGLSIFLP